MSADEDQLSDAAETSVTPQDEHLKRPELQNGDHEAEAKKRNLDKDESPSPPEDLPEPRDGRGDALESTNESANESDATSKPDIPPVQVESPPENDDRSSTLPSSSAPSTAPPPSLSRERTDSQSTVATAAEPFTKSSTRGSVVFVIGALEQINTSKDAARHKPLKDLTEKALNAIRTTHDPTQIDPRILFAPLRVATEEANADNIVNTALDCIGKLISYSYFSVPAEKADGGAQTESLIDQAIDTICNCFEGEATSDRVQIQIVMSLLSAVLNDKVIVHGAGLLKAVRQMYNIFLHSKSTQNQQIAQGTLSQMIGTVFERARSRIVAKEARINLARSSRRSHDNSSEQVNGDSVPTTGRPSFEHNSNIETPIRENTPDDVPVEKEREAKITLQTFERRGSFDETLREGPTVVTRVRGRATSLQPDGTNGVSGADEDVVISEEDEEDEVFMKDAFLVFRAMCKISIKPLRPEELADLKSQGMRTKLLSLHIIHTVLFNNVSLFLSPHATIRGSADSEPTQFTHAIKQLLCQSLSRNGASSVNRVFEVGCEIFWMMLRHLRVLLKKECEVFLKEIYLQILDNRTAPVFQKQCFLNVLDRLVREPRALVEVYLNYDCDRSASDNMFQRIVENLARIASERVTITSTQGHAYQEKSAKKQALHDWQLRGGVPPSLTTVAIGSAVEVDAAYPMEFAMKVQSLETTVETLRSLVHWAQQSLPTTNSTAAVNEPDVKLSADDVRESSDARPASVMASPFIAGVDTPSVGTPLAEDDPMQLEKAKQRKTALLNAVRQFNFKPKRGIKALIENGFIKSDSPDDIAQFLLNTERLDKAALGEYLGEGDDENIKIMHAFVDSMDFTRTRFVDALRRFLQSFRLPGEAQKIDRFMLKFAERYILGNPNAFANADTAYVLAYSVIMLNTDQHSSKMKSRRMTPEDFIKNNRGINDGADLPEEYLKGIFEEIASNEIVLNTEREAAANMGYASQPTATGITSGITQTLSNMGRDLQREAYVQRSEQMANKTEQLFRSLMKTQRKTTTRDEANKFIPATSFRHVGPMVDVTWMSFLTALSSVAQDTQNLDTFRLCMDGMKLAIQVACLFNLENPRMAFVSSIARFTNLYNLSEMQAKNVEALRVLLDVAYSEGNLLRESWRDILTCVSQLDRFQLLSEGVPEKALPDVMRTQSSQRNSKPRSSLHVPNRGRTSSGSTQTSYRAEIAQEARGAEITHGVDRIFVNTGQLSGEAIVDFVRALTQVSWQEIESSGQSQEPRTYSLQKLVEVSGYNMGRVRFEWSNIWAVLGDHFNQVGCNANTKVVYFALNSLRQLSMRFLELEELPGFKFQKDFLKPFEHIIGNTATVQVKEIVLHSLIQMIQARGENIRSGWRTIFGVFTVAAREPFEGVVSLAYDNVIQIYNTRLGVIMTQGALADLVVCLTEFSKNSRFQKKSLQAIETLKASIPKMLKTPECPLSAQPTPSAHRQPSRQTQEEQYWFPVLFAFHDVLMTGDDLEVRSRALNYLFDALIKYGKQFPQDFWDTIWRQLLHPIFMVLKSKSEMTKMVNHEELSVWLSTTMIQALRNMMSLFTHYFESLEYMLDRFLDLLALCICQENDTLARIGSNCLQTLILSNVNKFTPEHWQHIVNSFVDLFNRTEATALFSAAAASYGGPPPQTTNGVPAMPRRESSADQPNGLQLTGSHHAISGDAKSKARNKSPLPNGLATSEDDSRASTPAPEIPPVPSQQLEDYGPTAQLQSQPVVVTAARRRFFNQIITKCVLQLLMIETVNELFSADSVYSRIPSADLLRLMSLLKKSYHFAKRFNDDLELRNRLFNEGFMKQPPNLLKQESGSASVYVNILFRMYLDERTERRNSRDQTEAALIPLCVDIIRSYASLSAETQHRNIVTWRPVVVDVVDGFANFPPDGFEKHVSSFAPLLPQLMGRELTGAGAGGTGGELQRAVQSLTWRVLELHYSAQMEPLEPWAFGKEALASAAQTPTSPRANVFMTRRGSRAGSIRSASGASEQEPR
ncbi:MAG: hypothetical protein Q9162_002313 [Coniocarpon cinnabarinum]